MKSMLIKNTKDLEKIKSKKGFTLVELIIVITILAILATIAFISFQGYSKNARDGNRLTTMKNIESGLGIYYTKVGNYPETESGTLIQSSGGLTTIGAQGYFGDNSSRLLGFSKTPTDPYDGNKYVYSVNESKNRFQILGFLETSDYLSLVKNTYAFDYSTRIVKTLGDNLGIILDEYNNPINGNSIDIDNYNGNLKIVFSNDYISIGNGGDLKIIKYSFKDGKMWKDIDKNCDLPDVVIGDQIWAGCNSTLGYGSEWGQRNTDNNIYYDYTIRNCYKYSSTILSTTTDCPVWLNESSMLSNSKESSWSGSIGVNGVQNNIWGKFYRWNDLEKNCKGGDFTGKENNIDCPCQSGRHIPTYDEFLSSINYLWINGLGNSSECGSETSLDSCVGLGWKDNHLKNKNTNLIQALKIPLSGYLFASRGDPEFEYRGTTTILASSSYQKNISFYYDSEGPLLIVGKLGHIVRCVKD